MLQAIVLTAALLFTPGWLAGRRLTRQSLDILTRRVELVAARTDDPEIEESCRKCLYHLDALRGRFGKIGEAEKITLDSKDEQRVILQAMGLAGIKEARREFWREKWNAVRRFVWRKIRSALLHSLPWGVIVTALWFSRKRLLWAVVGYDRDAEKLPQETRLETFTNPRVRRMHAKLKDRPT